MEIDANENPGSNVPNRYCPISHEVKRTGNMTDSLLRRGTRNAKWYYSTFHNITAMVGAGVLALPYAMAQLGWGPGIVIMVLSWMITLYTLWQMIEMHEKVKGKRFDRYHELGQEAFGRKLGLWLVVPQQLLVEVGLDITYMVTGGQCLNQFYSIVCKDCKEVSLYHWIIIFASPKFLLSQLPSFNGITFVSLAAAIMRVSYSTIAWGAAIQYGRNNASSYEYKYAQAPTQIKFSSTTNAVFHVFNALGVVVFAYGGHNVVLEIQATLPSTQEKPSKIAMWRGSLVAYFVVAFCYFGVAILGYWAFGNDVEDNILNSLERPPWLIAMANLMVVVHVIGSYQIYAMPVYDMMETLLEKKFHLSVGLKTRIITRSSYVAFTCFVGLSIPFFSQLLGFVGGFALAPTTYFLPCMMWLLIDKPHPFSISCFANWVCIILGVILMFAAAIGGLMLIIEHASKYKFYDSG